MPYSITFGGTSVTLGSPISQGAATDISGSLKTLQVQVTDIGAAQAGSYKDTITITVQSAV